MASGPFIWEPSEEIKAKSRIGEFLRHHGLADYAALCARADADTEWFWNAVIAYFDLRFPVPYTRVLDLARGMAWPDWCVGGKTNVVLNCLDRHMDTPMRHKPAIVWEGEDGQVRTWNYETLFQECGHLAALLRRRGIRKGDVVAIYMPMLPETVAALFAIIKSVLSHSRCSPDSEVVPQPNA